MERNQPIPYQVADDGDAENAAKAAKKDLWADFEPEAPLGLPKESEGGREDRRGNGSRALKTPTSGFPVLSPVCVLEIQHNAESLT